MTSRPDPEPRSPSKAALAALELAQGYTIKEAARRAGLSEKTVRRWARGERFKAKVEGLRTEHTTRVLNMLAYCSSAAVVELARLMTKSPSDSIRLGAAKALLDKLPVMSEYFDLSERVRALEQRPERDREDTPWG